MLTKQMRELERQSKVVTTKRITQFQSLQNKLLPFKYKNGNQKVVLFNFDGQYEMHELDKDGDWLAISGTGKLKELRKWVNLIIERL